MRSGSGGCNYAGTGLATDEWDRVDPNLSRPRRITVLADGSALHPRPRWIKYRNSTARHPPIVVNDGFLIVGIIGDGSIKVGKIVDGTTEGGQRHVEFIGAHGIKPHRNGQSITP